MNNVLSEEVISDYLSELKNYTLRLKEAPDSLDEMILFIDQKLNDTEIDTQLKNFFMGERNFYSGYYEAALKHYLQAKNVPHFEFYCFRASAFAAKSLGNFEKAMSYYEKAKKIYPEETSLDALFEESQKDEQEEQKDKQDEVEQEQKDELTNQQSSSSISGFFASIRSEEPLTTPTLIERLFTEETSETKEENSPSLETKSAIKELKEATEEVFTIYNDTHEKLEYDTNDKLENTIREHLAAHENSALEYIHQKNKRPSIENFTLFMINGWKTTASALTGKDSSVNLMYQLLQNHQQSVASCGFYIRWNNKGIVINPGEGFLKNFHKNGLFITDIDYVIVTRNESESYADVRSIYHLNYQINKVSAELHIIQYYLNQASFQDLSRILNPNFKQERNAIHSLEIFIDSPEVEKVEITPEITLNYFSTYQRNISFDAADMQQMNLNKATTSPSLGIRLDLTSNDMPILEGSDRSVKLGYITGASWSPLLAHHLGYCDLLIAGFGHTCTADFSKVDYNERCLGYYGIFSLYEDLNPQLLLCAEFDGREGDIRLDIVKKMRQESHTNFHSSKLPSVILPGDAGLSVNLKDLKIQCSITQEWLEPSLVQVVKTTNSFGHLKYLSPDSCL